LYGLGSNDAGASLVSLLATFIHFYADENLKYNLVYVASAEEENSGLNGIELALPEIGAIEFAIVGEPTLMQMVIAEKGLMVLDCTVKGKAGHAAREEGENALYKALADIEWFKTYQFPKVSPMLGKVKMSVTVIQAGSLHNMVPEACTFTVDVRCTVAPRSLRIRPSFINSQHPVVQRGVALGRDCYGSPTTSDQALMPFPSLKMGVGDSARSPTADEFVYLHEIREGINLYIQLLTPLLL
jgi:acetylornithine deacetylase